MIVTINKLWVGGIALFPFIFLNGKLSPERKAVLLNHERIHIRQQIELLVIPFYIIYLFNYLFNLIKYKEHKTAYRNIIFEKEAFLMEGDYGYLKRRRFWAFIF
jgi:hypothetical protein